MISQKALKSTKVKMEESLIETDDSSVVAPYSNHLEEQEFITETMENEIKEEESKPTNSKKKKKNIKNPLPSITVDGSQLTFVEETKVIAEIDALIKHNRVWFSRLNFLDWNCDFVMCKATPSYLRLSSTSNVQLH